MSTFQKLNPITKSSETDRLSDSYSPKHANDHISNSLQKQRITTTNTSFNSFPIGANTPIQKTDNAVPPSPSLTGTEGLPLIPSVKSTLENSFGTDLNSVRVHQNSSSETAAHNLSTRSFTYGSNIYLGRGERTDDMRLMGHEVAHTIQQEKHPTLQMFTPSGGDRLEHDANLASEAALREEYFDTKSHPTIEPKQRSGLGFLLDRLAKWANNIPGFTLLTFIIGRNPINMKKVERNFENFLRSFMGLALGGDLLFKVLKEYGIVEKIGMWLDKQFVSLGLTYNGLRSTFVEFIDSLELTDIFRPDYVWERGKEIFVRAIDKIIGFGAKFIDQTITWLRETFMEPVSNLCRKIPGYKIVTVLLGKDPFTDAPVERNALNVVRAFAEFIPGGEEKVDQIIESKALVRIYSWFMNETEARNLTWDRISGTIINTWDSLCLEDILHPIATFERICDMVGPLLSDLLDFAKASLMTILEFIFQAAMGAGGDRILAILKKSRDVFLVIIKKPVDFLKHLLGAVGKGISQFMDNILGHLKQGVIRWLVGPLAKAGVEIPERWDLQGIIKLVFQVLGLSWARIRGKLVQLIGEPAMEKLEKGFELVQEIREKGIVATLRDRVSEFFGGLRDSVLDSIKSFIQQRIVIAGVTKLLSLLNPVGAVIQAIIMTYTTIKFFIDKINEILEFVESITDSVSSIAAGAVGAAANYIENTMVRTIPLIIDFLARFLGLGNVGQHITNTIKKLQTSVDTMLDKAVGWIKKMASNFASKFLGGDPDAPPGERVNNALEEAMPKVNQHAGKKVGAQVLRVLLLPIKIKHQLKELDVVPENGVWMIRAKANPEKKALSKVLVGNLEVQPVLNYKESTLNLGGKSDTIGIEMTYEYLAPNHGQGSGPGSGEQARIFEHLPTIGKANDNDWPRDGRSIFIKGHLLNDNLGGPGIAKNLFPITAQANKDHNLQIEETVKEAINRQGLLAYYSVKVTNIKSNELGIKCKESDKAMYMVDATFECEFDTYKVCSDSSAMVRSGNTKSVSVHSKSNLSPVREEITSHSVNSEEQTTAEKFVSPDGAARMNDFRKDDVLWALSHKNMKEVGFNNNVVNFFEKECQNPETFAVKVGGIRGIGEIRQNILKEMGREMFNSKATFTGEHRRIAMILNEHFK